MVARECQWNDAMAQASLGMCLTGSARSWFQGIEQENEFSSQDPKPLTPLQWKDVFLEMFSDMADSTNAVEARLK